MKHRREKREYHVAGKFHPLYRVRETHFDGRLEGVWQDPPGYFEKIVWPAYEKAHVRLFEGDNHEAGKANITTTIGRFGDPVPGLFVVEGTSPAGSLLEQSVHMILHTVSP